jgi:F-type H+-transporting ATPase subunit a
MKLEFVNILELISKISSNVFIKNILINWQDIIFSISAGLIVFLFMFIASRNLSLIPNSFKQNFLETIVTSLEDFICMIIGKKGKKFLPFIGTLFLYILVMNLLSLIPFFKSPTTNLSITLALSICVFVYVQYTAFKELGFLGYADHLAGNPRGALAYSLVFPIFLFCLHVLTEFIRPLTLAIRLRSNIWGDDLILAIFSSFGIKGIPLFLFNYFMAFMATIIQAAVFCILTTVYFSMVMKDEEHS